MKANNKHNIKIKLFNLSDSSLDRFRLNNLFINGLKNSGAFSYLALFLLHLPVLNLCSKPVNIH